MKKRLLVLMGVCVLAFSGCGGEKAANTNEATVKEEASEEKDTLESVLSKDSSEKAEASEEKKEESSEVTDADTLAKEVLSNNSFEEELAKVDLSTVEMFYNLSDISIKDAAFYESSGATAEEVAVVVCEDEANADKMEECFKTRVEEQTENFTDYVPKELKKLEKYSLTKEGNVVTFVVAIAE